MSKRNTKRVDLTKLFVWNSPITIKDENGDEALVAYQRVLNDNDFERARLSAVRESRKTRLALRDQSSGEYAMLMETLESYDEEQLIDMILVQKFDSYNKRASESAKTKMPKRPLSTATQEEIEEYESKVDEFNDAFNTEIITLIKEFSEVDRKELNTQDRESLVLSASKATENQICSNVAATTLDNWCAYLGTYSDSTFNNRLFASFEDYSNLAQAVKTQLIEGYKDLIISQGALKNLD